MERWIGRTMMVTGASSGIGEATSRLLVKNGMQVVGIARRLDRLEEIAIELASESGKFYPVKCDLTNEQDIVNAFKWVNENLNGVDVLINNAGIFNPELSITDGPTKDFRDIIETNFVSVVICTQEALQSMKAREVDDGHIIFVNSFTGHYVPRLGRSLNVYPATKHAITALTEILRQELTYRNSNIKVSSLSPGYVETSIKNFVGGPALQPEDCADAIYYILGTPPHVQVHELMIRPVREAF